MYYIHILACSSKNIFFCQQWNWYYSYWLPFFWTILSNFENSNLNLCSNGTCCIKILSTKSQADFHGQSIWLQKTQPLTGSRVSAATFHDKQALRHSFIINLPSTHKHNKNYIVIKIILSTKVGANFHE